MANLLKTLIPLLSAIALLLATTMPADAGDAVSFTYDFYTKPPNWEGLRLEGDANFTDATTYLRMTKTDESGKALKYSAGRAVYSKPIPFWDDGMKVDLETTIKFIINPNSGDTDPADGFTFFIQPVDTPMGSNGGSFGVFDDSGNKPNTFAIEFDIYKNTYDPEYRHVGIDIESVDSVRPIINVGNALLGQEVTARIDYEEVTKVISVHVMAGSQTYDVSYVKDLTTILPRMVQVGISASTGGQVAVHDLISWYFTATPVNTVYAEEGSGNILRQNV